VLGEPEVGWREAEAAIDAATARFGRDAVRPARLLRAPAEEPAGSDPSSGTDAPPG
jgi:DNA polymerase IV